MAHLPIIIQFLAFCLIEYYCRRMARKAMWDFAPIMHKKRGTATNERFHSWSEENNNSLKLVAIRKQLHR